MKAYLHKSSQFGFAPMLVVFIVAIIAGAFVLVIKNLPINQPNPAPKTEESSKSAQVAPTPTSRLSQTTSMGITGRRIPGPYFLYLNFIGGNQRMLLVLKEA